jgi:hypothetical protein
MLNGVHGQLGDRAGPLGERIAGFLSLFFPAAYFEVM